MPLPRPSAPDFQALFDTAPGRYLLLVRWETLEAHTVGFRQSAAFGEWRGILSPFFAGAPVVEHYEGVLEWPVL